MARKKFTKEEIASIIRGEIAEQVGQNAAGITNEKTFKADLDFDVLDHIELIMGIEGKFGVEFRDEITDQETVGGLINYVTENLEKEGMVEA